MLPSNCDYFPCCSNLFLSFCSISVSPLSFFHHLLTFSQAPWISSNINTPGEGIESHLAPGSSRSLRKGTHNTAQGQKKLDQRRTTRRSFSFPSFLWIAAELKWRQCFRLLRLHLGNWCWWMMWSGTLWLCLRFNVSAVLARFYVR